MLIIGCKNDNSACLHFLIISPESYFFFSSFSFPAHNSATVGNILMVVGRILEQVNAECNMQEGQFCLSSFF